MPPTETIKEKRLRLRRTLRLKKKPAKEGKRRWTKKTVKERLDKQILMDESLKERFVKEVALFRLITPAIVSERLKITIPLAKNGIRFLIAMKLVKKVLQHSKQWVFTRVTVVLNSEE